VNINMVKTTYWFNKMLKAMTGSASVASGPLSASKIGLGTGTITMNPAMTYAQLVEATFQGYLESNTVTWSGAGNESDGSQSSYASSWTFLATGSASPNNIANCFLTDGVGAASLGNASTGIFGAVKISPVIPIVNPGDYVEALVQWNESGLTPNSNIDIQS
jgi:hypothetical protein